MTIAMEQQQQQQVEEDADDDDYLQHVETPLHACSLETYPYPMEASWGGEDDGGDSSPASVWGAYVVCRMGCCD